ncbi:MAG: PEP-CTERM sorting domain-containing protein [Verrucomicrobiota bacterium]
MINRALPFSLAAAIGLATVSSASAVVLLFDVGAAGTQAVAPTNNIVEAQAAIANATDTTGSATGISVATVGFNASNTNGTTSPTGAAGAIFGSPFTQDSLFGNSLVPVGGAPFNGVLRPSATLTFSGLDVTGATSYSFDFFASRTGVTDNRETEYAVAGLTTVSAFLNASANVSEIATVSNMIPTAGGTITLTVDPGPNNNNTNGFYYLGAFRLTTAPVPEPSSAGLLILGAAGALRRRRSVR